MFRMRSSPRKRSGAATCSTPVEIFSLQQLLKIPIGELRHLAAEKHSIKNVALLKKPELLTKLREHFESRHGLQLTDEKTEEREEVVTQDVSPISQTIDRLRSRIKDSNLCECSERVYLCLLQYIQYLNTVHITRFCGLNNFIFSSVVVQNNLEQVSCPYQCCGLG